VRKLNVNQQLFMANLLKGMDAKRAYEAVPGYKATGKAAESASSRLCKLPYFQHHYQKALDKIADKASATKERVVREECRIAYSDLRQLFNGESLLRPDQLPGDIARAVSSFKEIHRADGAIVYEYRFWDKGRALERISKHLGMYEKDNQQRQDPAFLLAILSALPPEYAQAVKNRLREITQETTS